MDNNTYKEIVGLVIDQLEGGYYHPQMLADGRVKDSRYSNSGETMFGIDRKAGGSLNDTIAGKQFWGIIDNAGAKNSWSWNYKGGQLQSQLKSLAADIIYPEFVSLSNRYLSPAARQLVENDKRLLFNFVYATWNGSGWFQKFAKKINEAVASGITNTDELTKIAVAARTESQNSLISQGGNKIAQIVNTLKQAASQTTVESIEALPEKIKNNPLKAVVGAGLVVVGLSMIGFIWYKSKE